MKHITIKRELRRKLHDYSEYGETNDEAINRLIHEAGDISEVYPALRGSTSIDIKNETDNKLVSLKQSASESYSDVLERLFKKISFD